MNFYENLEYYLNRKGIKAAKMCADLNIPKSSVTQWKDGTLPTCTNLLKMTKYFDITPNDLLIYHGSGDYISDLNGEEEYLIEMFRKCNDGGKIAVREYAAFEASRAKVIRLRR